MTFTAPDGRRDELLAVLAEYFGEVTRTTGGQFFCKSCHRFEHPGVELHFGHPDGFCVVNLRGGALSQFDGEARHKILTRIMGLMGIRCTRIDVAADFQFCGLELVRRVHQACEARELTGAKCYVSMRPMTGDVCTGASVTIGKRGNEGSGKMLCVYDKGLEQNTGLLRIWEEGEWERVEGRFFSDSDRANQAAVALVMAGDDWRTAAYGLLFNIVDFREFTGDRHTERRARVSWWSSLIDDIPAIATAAKRRLSSLASRVRWLAGQVAPGLDALMKAAGLATPGQVLDMLVGHRYQTAPDTRGVVAQFGLWCQGGADEDELWGVPEGRVQWWAH
jgi:DNA relaxase NicK